ncbi:MAG: carboxypeptidase M32, partial [Anaerobacillus sp.]
MNNNLKQTEEQFLQYVKKMTSFNEAIGVMYWDLRTGAPKKGAEQRSEVIGMMSSEVFEMSVSPEMKAYLDELMKKESQSELSEITRKTVEECYKEYERNSKIPSEEYSEYVVLSSKAETIWEEAKEQSNFEIFRPYLEKLV